MRVGFEMFALISISCVREAQIAAIFHDFGMEEGFTRAPGDFNRFQPLLTRWSCLEWANKHIKAHRGEMQRLVYRRRVSVIRKCGVRNGGAVLKVLEKIFSRLEERQIKIWS